MGAYLHQGATLLRAVKPVNARCYIRLYDCTTGRNGGRWVYEIQWLNSGRRDRTATSKPAARDEWLRDIDESRAKGLATDITA